LFSRTQKEEEEKDQVGFQGEEEGYEDG